MQVSISRALHAKLLALAAEQPDREICGLLFGTAERIEAILACANVAAHPEVSFEIDPSSLIAAHKRERAGEATIIGCFHSHPNGVRNPSERDFASAVVGAIWLILARDEVTLWHKTDAQFEVVNLVLD